MKNVISFVLDKVDLKNTLGLYSNIHLAKIFFPDWEIRVHVYSYAPKSVCVDLKALGAVLCGYDSSDMKGWSNMLYGFLPIDDENVSAMIVRSNNARLTFRESLAVHNWMKSDFKFHVIRDHPNHNQEIPEGLWGIKKGALSTSMAELIKKWKPFASGTDSHQDFLKQIIYPLVKNTTLAHDELFNYPDAERRNFFMKRAKGDVYAGLICNSKNEPDKSMIQLLENYLCR